VVEASKQIGRRALAIRADSADEQAVTGAVDRTAAEFGRLDILVNNARAYLIGEFAELSSPDVAETLAVNVRAPFVAAQTATRHMRAGGRISTIGSMVVDRSVFPGHVLYAMSKSALSGFTRVRGRELGPKAITVPVRRRHQGARRARRVRDTRRHRRRGRLPRRSGSPAPASPWTEASPTKNQS
jgi:3-oxoacyl-[acyl-carrier protein] reductase